MFSKKALALALTSLTTTTAWVVTNDLSKESHAQGDTILSLCAKAAF
jgi:hypothetical protein